MGWSLTLGNVAGVRIRVHLTFLLFLAWIGLGFWQQGGAGVAARGLAFILLLFLCVVLHEFGHILMARRFGSQTEDVILLPIGGVARMKTIPERPAQELLVALAGPCVNLVIAALLIAFAGPERLVRELADPGNELHIHAQLTAANVVLAVFNLLPAFPMDGGRALRALLSFRMGRVRATALATRIGHILAVGLGIYGFLAGLPLLMLVALFIYFGATAENGMVQTRSLADRFIVSEVMITQFSALPVTGTIGEAVAVLVHSTQHDIPVVDGVGKVVGLLTRNDIVRALHDHGRDFPIADAMIRDVPTLPEHAPLEQALRLMEDRRFPAVAVANRDGRLTGMVTLEGIGQLIALNRIGGMPRDAA